MYAHSHPSLLIHCFAFGIEGCRVHLKEKVLLFSPLILHYKILMVSEYIYLARRFVNIQSFINFYFSEIFKFLLRGSSKGAIELWSGSLPSKSLQNLVYIVTFKRMYS